MKMAAWGRLSWWSWLVKSSENAPPRDATLDAVGALHLQSAAGVSLRDVPSAGHLPLRGRGAAGPGGRGSLDRVGRGGRLRVEDRSGDAGAVLAGLPAPTDRRVLVGMAAGDDAGVFLLDQRTALVQTVDVFSPPVDDPFLFGQIAAANSLSDVYAMGGRPLTALSVVGFPAGKLPDDVLRQILRGGLEKMAEAGVSVIGGHSIKDDEIKAGFAVTGLVDPQAIMTNAGMRPGDRLVLTKPLGTGIVALAAQIGRAELQQHRRGGALDGRARTAAPPN